MADPIQGLWLALRKQPSTMLALAGFGLILALVILGPMLWPHDARQIASDPAEMLRLRNQGISLAHPMGTDQLGRDMLARVLWGGRISLAVGFGAMLVAIGIGTTIGMLAGSVRRLDALLMRLTDLFLSLPLLPLLLLMMVLFRDAIAARIGPGPGSFALIMLAIGLTGWMPAARLVRAEVVALNAQDFIRAARAIGVPAPRLLLHHILPNLWGQLQVAASLGIASAMLAESTLSFLGFGLPPDVPTWGRLLHDGVGAMRSDPTHMLWPGAALALTLICVSQIGEGLRRASDPHRA